VDWIDVLQRIQAGEDAHTELGRFRSFGDKDWQESVCAFANTEGGLVILGVTDDRAIDGVPMDQKEVQERLSNALHNAFNAPIQARLGCHQDPNGWVHWIEVARAAALSHSATRAGCSFAGTAATASRRRQRCKSYTTPSVWSSPKSA
jgi:ATP-dependent DNA helicase RecG